MDINTALKGLIDGYVSNLNLSDFSFATYVADGIQIDNKPKIIPMDFVVVPQHLTDFSVAITIETPKQEITVNERDGASINEDVKLTMNKVDETITIHNALKPGDKVIIGKATGNQKIFILDRVV